MDFVNRFLLLHAPLLSAVASETPEDSIISIDVPGMLQMLFNVLVMIIILSVLLYKPVRNFMDKRKEGIRKELEDAENANKQAEEVKEEYEAQLRDIEKERDQILLNANTKAMQRSEEIIKEAREEAELIHKHAMVEISEERAAMQSEVKRQLIDLSVSIAERFVTVSMDAQTQSNYVDDAIAKWEEDRWQD